jgi:curved DNA-binding protein CbpA
LLADYLMLGLEPGATDDQIRRRYLALIKLHPPEKDPQRFQDLNQAYERIRDQRARIHHKLFGYYRTGDVEASLDYLRRAVQPSRKRAGLQALLKALQKQTARSGG